MLLLLLLTVIVIVVVNVYVVHSIQIHYYTNARRVIVM